MRPVCAHGARRGMNRPMRGDARQQWRPTGAGSEYPEAAPRAPGLRWPPAGPPDAGPRRRHWRLVAVALLGVLLLFAAPSIGRASVASGAVTAAVSPDAPAVSPDAPAVSPPTTTAATNAPSQATTNLAP